MGQAIRRTPPEPPACSTSSAPAPAAPPRPLLLRTIVFVVGAASLGAEISAARLLAPYFGASTIIWANTIATVLVALSAGYAIGGRLADRRADLRGLCAIVLLASVLLLSEAQIRHGGAVQRRYRGV